MCIYITRPTKSLLRLQLEEVSSLLKQLKINVQDHAGSYYFYHSRCQAQTSLPMGLPSFALTVVVAVLHAGERHPRVDVGHFKDHFCCTSGSYLQLCKLFGKTGRSCLFAVRVPASYFPAAGSMPCWPVVVLPHCGNCLCCVAQELISAQALSPVWRGLGSLADTWPASFLNMGSNNSGEVCDHSNVPNDQPGPCGHSGEDFFAYGSTHAEGEPTDCGPNGGWMQKWNDGEGSLVAE